MLNSIVITKKTEVYMKLIGTFKHINNSYEVYREIVNETVLFIVHMNGKEISRTPVPFIEYCNHTDVNDIEAKDSYYFEAEKSKIVSSS